jgi:hypothetical protein
MQNNLEDDHDFSKRLYLGKSLLFMQDDIPETVLLNDSININLLITSANPDYNQIIEVELLAAGIRRAGRNVQRKNLNKGQAIYNWNLNFLLPGRHEILLIFRSVDADYVESEGSLSTSIRVKSFFNSYRDISILLAIISALITISSVLIKFFWS